MSEEKVILVDKNDNQIGFMPKLEAHQKGVLHRAFSIFIFNKQGYLQVGVNFEEKNIDSLNEDFLNTIVDRVIFEDGYKYSDFTSSDKKSDYSIEDIIIKS